MTATVSDPFAAPPAPLTAALENALLRELVATWKQLNGTHFEGALRLPQLALSPVRSRLGQWSASTRTLEISRPLVLSRPWGAVVEVLKHEMAHQYVHEVLSRTDETAHGPAFRETCARLGIDAAASGLPAAPSAEGAPRDERVVERIARLLALAESPHQHEAEAAMAAAQRLMLKYNIEVAKDAAARSYGHRHLGRATGRVTEGERLLAMILGKYFFVEVIWVSVYRPLEGKRGSVLEICGTPANLAMAEYVHGFLSHAAESLWAGHRRAHRVPSNRDRRVFIAGVMSGFAEKLAREGMRHQAEGLVWVKDGDLAAFYRRRHPHVRLVRHAGHRRNDAYAHGREAGKRIVLSRAMAATAEGRGHLLPPRRG